MGVVRCSGLGGHGGIAFAVLFATGLEEFPVLAIFEEGGGGEGTGGCHDGVGGVVVGVVLGWRGVVCSVGKGWGG